MKEFKENYERAMIATADRRKNAQALQKFYMHDTELSFLSLKKKIIISE